MKMDPADVVERTVKKAFHVLVTSQRLDGPAGYRSSMPEPVRDPREVFAAAVGPDGFAPLRLRQGPATNEDLALLQVVLDWLLWLPEFERRLVSARACRVTWRSIAQQDVEHRSVRQLQRIHRDALLSVAANFLIAAKKSLSHMSHF